MKLKKLVEQIESIDNVLDGIMVDNDLDNTLQELKIDKINQVADELNNFSLVDLFIENDHNDDMILEIAKLFLKYKK